MSAADIIPGHLQNLRAQGIIVTGRFTEINGVKGGEHADGRPSRGVKGMTGPHADKINLAEPQLLGKSRGAGSPGHDTGNQVGAVKRICAVDFIIIGSGAVDFRPFEPHPGEQVFCAVRRGCHSNQIQGGEGPAGRPGGGIRESDGFHMPVIGTAKQEIVDIQR